MKFKSYKRAEEYALSRIDNNKMGYVISSNRKWFRRYYYVSFYFKTIISDYES